MRRTSRALARVAAGLLFVAILGPVPVAGAPHRVFPSAQRASAEPRPAWKRSIDRLVAGRDIGVSVRESGTFLYRHRDVRRRIPASNEKLLLSMALLDRVGPEATLLTQAAVAAPVAAGVVAGDLWILGTGDPDVRDGTMRRLAREVSQAGVGRIEGSVIGSTGYFSRDWRAPGWKRDFPRTHVALPTALAFDGNQSGGIHITDPEKRAARALTKTLRRRGVHVAGPPSAGRDAPVGVTLVAQVASDPVGDLLGTMNRYSSNFWAEVLGKRLGAEASGPPGSIAKGAAAIRAWAAGEGVALRAYDGSGLSYANRVSPGGIVRLLDEAEDELWGAALLEALPEGGQGTLQNRLRRLPVHAKTGTLSGVSALSGYVRLRRTGAWAEFSILSRGLSKDRAVRIEDAIVRILWRSAA